MAKINQGLNLGKNKSGLFFFWLGHELGPISKRGPWGPVGVGPSPREKTRYPKRGGSGYEKTRPEPDPLPFLGVTELELTLVQPRNKKTS